MYSIYHHVSQEHLKRYLCELISDTNTAWRSVSEMRTVPNLAINGIAGKRLTYRRIDGKQEEAGLGKEGGRLNVKPGAVIALVINGVMKRSAANPV